MTLCTTLNIHTANTIACVRLYDRCCKHIYIVLVVTYFFFLLLILPERQSKIIMQRVEEIDAFAI